METEATLPFKVGLQKELAKYQKKTEFADAIHILRYARGLRIPKGVRDFLDWVGKMNGSANEKNGVGCFFTSYHKIATEMKCSVRKVEEATKWLKKQELLSVVLFEETYYKVFADIESIKTTVSALVNQRTEQAKEVTEKPIDIKQSDEIVRKYVGDHVGTHVGGNVGYKRPNINNQDKTPLLNNYKSIRELDCVSNKSQNFNHKKEVTALLQNVGEEQERDGVPTFSKEENKVVGDKIQILLNKYQLDINDQNTHDLIHDTVYQCSQNPSDDFGAYIYVALENAIIDNVLKQQGHDIEQLINNRDYESLKELRQQFKHAYKEGTIGLLELAVTIEKPKKKKSYQPKYAKKPIRTEKPQAWQEEDKQETEQAMASYEAKEQVKRSRTVEEKKQSILEKLAIIRQSQESIAQTL
jgi:hypothetical protein